MEGWGVEEEFKFTNVMEKKTGREVMNFGSDFFLGPLQYEIQYREVASRFEHNLLIVGFAPHNDFTDNDLVIWMDTNHRHRYRPYYAPDGNTSVYLVDRSSDRRPISEMRRPGPTGIEAVKVFARELTWSFRLLEEIYQGLVTSKYNNVNPKPGYSGYRDFENHQLKYILGSFDRLILMAKNNERKR